MTLLSPKEINVRLEQELGDPFPKVINEETGEMIRYITHLKYEVSADGNGMDALEITVVPQSVLIRTGAIVVEDAELENWPDDVESEPEAKDVA